MKNIQLAHNVQMPVLGFGTFQIPAEETAEAVKNAIAAGYRHIDTAQTYFNEKEVGEGIKLSGVPREELFVTTKVWVSNYGDGKTAASVERSLERLGLDYADLVLLHKFPGDVFGAWRDLEKLQAAGKIRAIGVSSFTPMQLVNFGEFNKVMPQVNQIEINPFCQPFAEIAQLKKEGVAVQAWAPFAEGKNDIFHNPILVEIGRKYGKSVAQVILRWLVQQEITVLAKSVRPERMAENLDVFDFELSVDEMAKIETLDMGESQFFDHETVDTVRFMKGYAADI